MDTERIRLDFAAQIVPFWIYKRIPLTHYREYFLFNISYGYGYYLRYISVCWPELNQAGNAGQPPLSVEFYQEAIAKARQTSPINFNSFVSPAGDGVQQNAAPSAVDQDIFGKNFTAVSPRSRFMLNHFFPNGDNINIQITGQTGTAPAYVDLLCEGYYVPEKSIDLWKEKQPVGTRKYMPVQLVHVPVSQRKRAVMV